MCWHGHGHARDARNLDLLRNSKAFNLVARLRRGFSFCHTCYYWQCVQKKMFIIGSFSDGYRIKIAPITEIVYQDYLNMSPQSSYIPQITPSCLSVFNNSISHCVQLYTIAFLCVQLPECWGLSAWDPRQPRLSFCLCICLNLSLFHSLAILVTSKSPRPCWSVRDGTILHPDDSHGWKDLSSFVTQNYKLQGKFICELLFLILKLAFS